MPETDVLTPATDQLTLDPEVARQMDLALGITQPTQQANPADTAPVVVDNAITQPTDIFQPFKEKFGYNTPDEALAEIETLRQYKANPVAPTITFEDEESEKLFKAWTGGKKNEVFQYLEKANRIDNYLSKEITEDTAPDIVKLGMQLKYKDLSPEEVAYKFKKQFQIPSKPSQGSDEDESDYTNRLSAWKEIADDKKMELLIEAKLSRPEIEAAKSKLIVPEIESAVDEGYTQYKQSLESDKKLAEEAKEAYKVFTPKAIETKINFKDEANKIDFDFQYEPDAKSFAEAKEMVSNIDLFWNNFYNQDGSPNRQKFLDAVHFATNKDKIITEAIKQGKNAAIKAMLPDNTQGGLVRQLVQNPEQETDLDKQFRQAGFRKQ